MHSENKAEGVQWLSNRNTAGQERVPKYIQTDAGTNLKRRILYSAKLSFRFEEEIRGLQTIKS